MANWLKFFAYALGILTPLYYVLDKNLESFYVFDKEHLHDLSKRAIAAHGNDTRAVAHFIYDELKTNERAAPYMNLDEEEWIINNAGGAMGAMWLLHASITEYLIIFGTAVGTEGHSGRHTADDYFHIIYGEQWAYVPGKFEKEVYPQGSVHHLARGAVKQYKMHEGCFALEYARGWIPPMLFFGYADALTSTLDLPTLWRTTWVTGRQMVGNLLLLKL